jgi:hypothetical protein
MRLWGIVIGCWCALSLGVATAQQVEFPLDYYSFAEIAQRMSIEGRRIECARDLRQRLALIHLKPRSWQETRELLEKALDVRFRKISDAENRWILERDPEVARVERQRRERLASYLDKEGAQDIRRFRLLLDKSVPPEKVFESAQEFQPDRAPSEAERQQVVTVIEMLREMPVETALRNWRAHKQLAKALAPLLDNQSEAMRLLTEKPLASYGFAQEELQWAERIAQGKDEKWAQMLGDLLQRYEHPLLKQVWALIALGDFTNSYASSWAADALMRQLQPPLRALDAIEQGVVARVYELSLPPELAAWLLNDVDGTKIPLNATEPVPLRLLVEAKWGRWGYGYDVAIEPLEPPSERRIYSLPRINARLFFLPEFAYRTFQRFDPELAQAYQAAYERHKQLLNDSSVRAPLDASARSLARTLYEWAQKHQAELIAEVLPEASYGSQGKTLAERLKNCEAPYLLERHDGVWALRSWVAFVQRVPDLPLTALRDLLRTKGDYADWRAFYRAITPEQARWLRVWREEIASFTLAEELLGTSLPVDNFAHAWLVMEILEHLPPAQRDSLWRYQGVEPVAVPLATLPPNARVQLARILDRWRAVLLTDKYKHLFAEDSASLVERLVLARHIGGWAIHLPDPAKTDTRETDLLFSTDMPGDFSVYMETGESEIETPPIDD